ncbi:hypothetical protein BDA96_09G182200 [Sorghum bicolor]|uniref:DNA helicase n=1 Tax=Sorghum bicolor TaxID=4558 RepID=A0A921QD25_SORBI|nr:hypothetical protein BDA96_09G182200 [Sorghum bicolor]
MELFVKEKETFKVLKELQETKHVIDALKVQIEKVTAEDTNAAKGHADTGIVHPLPAVEQKTSSHTEPSIQSTKGTQSPLTTLIKLNQAKAFLNTDTVNMLKSQIEKEKGSLEKTRERLQFNLGKASSLETDLTKTVAQLQVVKTPQPVLEPSEIWLQMKHLNAEKAKHKKVSEDLRNEICELTAAIEHTRSKTKTMQFRIVMAEKLKEASQRGESIALAEMKKLSNGWDLNANTSDVTLSVEEHSTFVLKAQEADSAARKKIDAAMQELDQANQCKLELLERVEEATAAVETSRKALEEAQRREESENKAKLAAEETLRKLRSDQIIQNWRPISNSSVKFKNTALAAPRRAAGSGIYDVNGLSLVTTGPNNVKTVSIGQILSMKLDRELEMTKTTNTRKKVSLGQILSQKYEMFSPLRIDHDCASRKQFQPRRKRMGFVVYALLLAKQRHRRRKAASCTHVSSMNKVGIFSTSYSLFWPHLLLKGQTSVPVCHTAKWFRSMVRKYIKYLAGEWRVCLELANCTSLRCAAVARNHVFPPRRAPTPAKTRRLHPHPLPPNPNPPACRSPEPPIPAPRPLPLAAPLALFRPRAPSPNPQAAMDVNEEAMAAHKRAFLDFLDQDVGKGVYMQAVRDMVQNKRHRLIIGMDDLRNHNLDLARRVIRSPGEYMQPASDAVSEVARNLDPKFLKEGERVMVGFSGPFGFHRVTPRDLMSSFIGTMVCVEGIVTKCSLVRPKVVKSVHFCPVTGDFLSREYRDITSFVGLPTGSVYPTRDENGNLLVTEYGMCEYKDHQTLSMQEVPENSAPGQLPRTVDVIVEDDLVDCCKPGDRVSIVGVYKALPGKSKGSVSGVFRTVLIANNVSLLNKEANAPVYTREDLKRMKEISRRNDTFDVLGNSLAPSIYGHLWIKKAVVLLMLGGVEKNLKNGTHLRGDINMMMVGDPSVAKSQLLRAVMNIAPLAISTTGRGSSGVGLTAAVTSDQETGERRLEAGAMVLADRGVVCIDEFDKMNDQDRVAIHEVMEQQTVTIAKAGIHASLNARCSVIAAANPIYGTYDRSLTPTKNIGLPDSLLSRFDLLFIVLDQMDPEIDRQISEHVARMHRYCTDDGGARSLDKDGCAEEDDGDAIFVKYDRMLHGQDRRRGKKAKQDRLTVKFVKKYIHYAKNLIQPKLTDEASDHIATSYAELRDGSANAKSGGGTLPITARTLETIIRLSTAHAKMKLRHEVLKSDVEAALQVLNFAIYHKELTEMEEREQREMEMKQQADHDAGATGGTEDGHGSSGNDPMDVDVGNTSNDQNVPAERIEAFEAILGQHVLASHVDQMSIDEIEQTVNRESTAPYTRSQVEFILERMQDANRIMIRDGVVRII